MKEKKRKEKKRKEKKRLKKAENTQVFYQKDTRDSQVCQDPE
jgi:hypothetical protein